MSTAVGVLIVDETAGLEPSFRAMLEHEPTLRTIGEQDIDDEEAGEASAGPVALVSVGAENLGVACARIATFREAYPALRIAVLFRALDGAAMRRLIEAGADGFIGRTGAAHEICEVIVAFARGTFAEGAFARGSYGSPEAVRPDTAERGGAHPDPREAPENASLTPREAEVLRFLSSGFSNKEVARRLSLSVRTVETHRLNLRRKTQTGRLKDLVSLARQLGLDPVFEVEARRNQSRH